VSFLGELRRRNVVKVAVAYAIVGWLLIEVAATVFPIVQLPGWTVTFLTMLILFGFPIALILSWAYEITADGMKRSHEVEATESITHVTGRKVDFAIIGALVLALGFFVYSYMLEGESEVADVLPNSVAVLPLENLSPDPDNAYFAAGMHEEILNHLAKLRNLNVISRTSVVRYTDSDLSVPEIANELNVKTVMEGSVRYANDRVLVTIQLIDPETDAHLWSESYNRDLSDIFAIQADIAMNVANALEAEFSLEEQESIESIPTDSPEAYEFYLRAVSLGGGTQVLDAAIEYLDSAIRLDPSFALAYAAKAWLSAAVLTGNVPAQQAEYERIAQENATQALALDPTLGLAHFALAFVHQAHWRWDEAELAFEEALRLNPNSAEVLSQYSRTKRYRGEYDVAVEVARRAAELDPQNWGSYFFLGITYQYTRNYDAAATSFRQALELNPTVGNLHAQLGFAQVSLGDWDDAVRELKVAEEIYGENIQSQRYSQLAAGYARMGRSDDVERLFHALEVRAENSPVTAAVWAQMYIALEDYDQALEWLETAVDSQAPDLVPLGHIKGNPYGNPALEEPRFQELRDRIGT